MKAIAGNAAAAVQIPCFLNYGTPVVIKAVTHDPQQNLLKFSPFSSIDSPLREIAALQHLKKYHGSYYHPNVSKLLDCFQDQQNVYLVLPYLSGGDLYSFMEAKDGKGAPEATVASYLHQIASGLLFMKQAGLAHGDVSLENIMFCNEQRDTLKVIDLGMSISVPKMANYDKQATCMANHHDHQKRPSSPPLLVARRGCFGKPGEFLRRTFQMYVSVHRDRSRQHSTCLTALAKELLPREHNTTQRLCLLLTYTLFLQFKIV